MLNFSFIDTIILSNIENIDKAVNDSFIEEIIHKKIIIDIIIDVMELYNTHPNSILSLINDCNLSLIKKEIILKIKNRIPFQNIKVFYEDLIEIKPIFTSFPNTILTKKLCDFYNYTLQKSELIDNKIYHSLSYPIISFKGKLTLVEIKNNLLSKIYTCRNNKCPEKKYLLYCNNRYIKFTNELEYTQEHLLCNCKSNLKELFAYRMVKSIYFYILSDRRYNIFCASDTPLNIINEDIYVFGVVTRFYKCIPMLHIISTSCDIKISNSNNISSIIKDIIVNENTVAESFATCLIITGILLLKENSILIYTDDSFYINHMFKNCFKILKIQLPLKYYKKEKKLDNGMYICSESKKKKIHADHHFYIKGGILDYKYKKIKSNIKYTLKEIDYLSKNNSKSIMKIFNNLKNKHKISSPRILSSLLSFVLSYQILTEREILTDQELAFIEKLLHKTIICCLNH
ncbi:hypothetical protein SLOPH_1823 [Spraguea lophii 42_110]|uniref:Uncharacterized protein n=1 Tax=Spraguea lophii (strain 42_110) TaxID=1358809 RepID=S7W9U3_SPRLO|nr:hypothetical protein SLOPH_1823 [Spraguea lophii 42_110]